MIITRKIRTCYFDEIGYIRPLIFEIDLQCFNLDDVPKLDYNIFEYSNKVLFIHGMSHEKCLLSHNNKIVGDSEITLLEKYDVVATTMFPYLGSITSSVIDTVCYGTSFQFVSRREFDINYSCVVIENGKVKPIGVKYEFEYSDDYKPTCSTCVELTSQIKAIIASLIDVVYVKDGDCIGYKSNTQSVLIFNSDIFNVSDMLNSTLQGMLQLAKIKSVKVVDID